MKQENKELLLKDLCARIPYGVIVCQVLDDGSYSGYRYVLRTDLEDLDSLRPYLRPMSSMTEEEREEFRTIGGIMSYSPQHDTWALSAIAPEAYDWLNAHHFDYRGLIEKGLAIEVTEENNPYN